MRPNKKKEQPENETESYILATPTPGAEFFVFDVANALSEKLLLFFDTIEPAPLSEENIFLLKDLPGVYVIFENDKPIYVGKADNSTRTRLKKHCLLIAGCQNLEGQRMTFKCANMPSSWNPFKPEEFLIDALKTGVKKGGWNGSGFGINDPGKNRADTNLKKGHFYRLHPINTDRVCPEIGRERQTALKVLSDLKSAVPFWFRFEGMKKSAGSAFDDLQKTEVEIPSSAKTAKEILRFVAESLPVGWQATITLSHMLLYKENKKYKHGEIIWPQP